MGVNSLDEACLEHDLAYGAVKSTNERNKAPDMLTMKASAIAIDEPKLDYERRDARLVTAIMDTKSRFGFGMNGHLQKIYYNLRTGYIGINDLVKKSGLSSQIVRDWLHMKDFPQTN